ncbi:tetratricopeptide repeat protein [Nemorincola caseinilytica]|uniref:Tetratricopeptide repeat protein n=1 Tax=Nemorincola caseinilytica TaxID=2054315 RepID=A0ABP8NQ09_9BACT
MNRIAAILALVMLSLHGMAADWQAHWKKATGYYIQKQYDSAAWYYEQVAALHPHNAEVYYNLGNTYYRLNKIAPAVLNYERALHVDPGHRDAHDNLTITQARISHQVAPAEDIFFVTWWRGLTAHTMAGTWAAVALIAFLMALGIYWARRYTQGGGRLPMQLPGILGFVSACAIIFGLVAAANSVNPRKAVVFEQDTPLMNAQQIKGKPAALLPEGTTVRIITDGGNWLEVALPDNRTGWVQASQVMKV